MACGQFSLSTCELLLKASAQSYEVIGSPPNVSVPTHFAKVILASKPSLPSQPDILELSMGAFVLPNATIPDEAPLESFVMPGEFASMTMDSMLTGSIPKWKPLSTQPG